VRYKVPSEMDSVAKWSENKAWLFLISQVSRIVPI